MSHGIELIESPARPVLSLRRVTSVDQLPLIIGKSYESIFSYLYQLGEQPADMPFVAYYNMDMNALEVEIGVPVFSPIQGTEEIQSGEIPEGKKVVAMHQGSYQSMSATYDAVNQWIAERALEPTGVVYEFYFNSPEEVPESELLTKIIFLLK